MFRFPFTNFHELNLDWILAKVKEFAELIPPMQTAVQDVQEAVDSAIEAIEQSSTALENANEAVETANEAKDIAEQAAQGVIPDNSITTAKIVNGAVNTVKIASNAVTSDKILNGAVTLNKLASEAKTIQNVIYIVFSNVSNSNLSFAASGITANHRLIPNSVSFSAPYNVTDDVTFTTSANAVNIQGDFDGLTDITAAFAVFQNILNR